MEAVAGTNTLSQSDVEALKARVATLELKVKQVTLIHVQNTEIVFDAFTAINSIVHILFFYSVSFISSIHVSCYANCFLKFRNKRTESFIRGRYSNRMRLSKSFSMSIS